MTNDQFSMTDFQPFQWRKLRPRLKSAKKVKCAGRELLATSCIRLKKYGVEVIEKPFARARK